MLERDRGPPPAWRPPRGGRRRSCANVSANGVGAQRVACPGPVSRSTVRRAGQRLLLEPGHDRAGVDGLAGEEVGGADQHADPPHRARPAARRPWRPSPPSGRRGCRRRAGSDSLRAPRVERVEQRLDGLVPQDEARPRADVAAALATLEDEPAGALRANAAAARRTGHAGRWRCRAPRATGLVGPAAGDERERRTLARRDLELCLPDVSGTKAEDAGTPPATPEGIGDVGEQRVDLAGPMRASARNGRPPASATAAANPGGR